MRNKFRESNQIVQWINKTNYSFKQYKNADVSIFQRYLSTKFQVQKRAFMKYFIFLSQIIHLYSLSFFNGKGQLLYYNVAAFILVQSEEEYPLIWKAEPLTIQTDKKVKKMTSPVT